MAYDVVYLDYHNLKSWNAFNSQHDSELLRIDSWLFFGHSPAVLLHSLFGQHVAAHVSSGIYESFYVLVPLVVVAMLVFANTRTERREAGAANRSSMMVSSVRGKPTRMARSRTPHGYRTHHRDPDRPGANTSRESYVFLLSVGSDDFEDSAAGGAYALCLHSAVADADEPAFRHHSNVLLATLAVATP